MNVQHKVQLINMTALCWTFIRSAILCYAYAGYVILCAIALKLDPHADISALTPSADWINCYFSVTFFSYLSLSLIFY